MELVYRPKGKGERTFVLEIDPRPRELQVENNRIERVVTVRKEKIKVLLVESEPRYEFRYLKNYLEREETIDLSVVLLSSDPEYSEQDRDGLAHVSGRQGRALRPGRGDHGRRRPGVPEHLADDEPRPSSSPRREAESSSSRGSRSIRWRIGELRSRRCCRSSWPTPATRRPWAMPSRPTGPS